MEMSITAEGKRAEGNGIRITREELDRAFDRRFPSWMKEKLNAAVCAGHMANQVIRLILGEDSGNKHNADHNTKEKE